MNTYIYIVFSLLLSSPRQLEDPCQDQTLVKVAAALKVGIKGVI